MLTGLAALVVPSLAGAVTLPPDFHHSTAITGLTRPMDVEVAPNGRVFVAEKSGIVKTYESLSDTTPAVAADLRRQVHNFAARGLVSLAVDPAFPVQPYIYVYYSLDATIGGTPPLYGTATGTFDSCAKAVGGLNENCVAAARVSRVQIDGEVMTGPEHVLIEDYCNQYPSHTGGGLEFGADGYLYVSGADGSTGTLWDWGQTGTPANPCGDPPGGVGDLLAPPTSEGGRLRSQDLRTAGDPTGLAGSLIRIDPATGEGAPGNPLPLSADANERRMLGYGLRDSARLAVRPGTSEIWVTDRGGGYWEEFNRVEQPLGSVLNFGWPCYEGDAVRKRSDDQDLNICEGLYGEPGATAGPYWAYDHELDIVPGESCARDAAGAPAGALVSGVTFYPAEGGNIAKRYRGALFFADRLRNCIYALLPGADGVPERGSVVLFASDAMRPTDIEVAPGGDLLYVDHQNGEVQRIAWVDPNRAPTAVATASPVSGVAPLPVSFDGSGSSDPDTGDVLSYEWDLDGDGELDDSTAVNPAFTYRQPGSYVATLRVTDEGGKSSTATVAITVRVPITTKAFLPHADTRVEEIAPLKNFGSASRIAVQGGSPAVESYLRFSLSGVVGPIHAAKLQLRALTDGTVDGPQLFTSPNTTWSQSKIHWNKRLAYGPTPIGDAAEIAPDAVVEYDVLPHVSPNGVVTFVLASASLDSVDFGSRDQGVTAKRPRLVVTFGG